METNAQNPKQQKSKWMIIALIVLGVLLLLALIAAKVNINRKNKLSAENQNLQNELAMSKDEGQRLLNEKNKSIEEVSGLKTEINTLQADYDEQLRNRNAQISWLRSQTKQAEQLKKQIEEYKVMETEFQKLQNQHSVVLADQKSKEGQIEKLSEELKTLEESIERSRGLNAYNISPLTKWERWFWADRYNVFRARRVNETAITFEIAGNDFTKTGNRTVYLNIVDPEGIVMYPSSEQFVIKETGEQSPFTQKKDINFTGEYLPMDFVVRHPDRLEPGTYSIKIYIDGALIRTDQINFE